MDALLRIIRQGLDLHSIEKPGIGSQVKTWLIIVALYLLINDCIMEEIAPLQLTSTLRAIRYPKCDTIHIDTSSHEIKKYLVHT